MVKDLEQRLQYQGLTLDQYYTVTGKPETVMRDEMKETAIKNKQQINDVITFIYLSPLYFIFIFILPPIILYKILINFKSIFVSYKTAY